MEDQLGALGQVLNCITLWNTFYMNAALSQLRGQGYPVRDEDVARLSPFARKHINVHGRYSFLLPELPGGRPPTAGLRRRHRRRGLSASNAPDRTHSRLPLDFVPLFLRPRPGAVGGQPGRRHRRRLEWGPEVEAWKATRRPSCIPWS
jgi:hypothetical protein